MASKFAERFTAKVKAPKAAAALGLDGPHPTGRGWKWIGQCPACAADGNDASEQHLAVFENGAFSCIVHQGDEGSQHRSRMAKLCPALRGDKSTGPIYIAPDLTAEREALRKAAETLLSAITSQLSGGIDSLGESGGILPNPRWQFDKFCNLFQPEDLAWVGTRFDAPPVTVRKNPETGEAEVVETPPRRQFQRHIFQAGEQAERERIFRLAMAERLDHTMGVVWQPGSIARTKDNAITARFAVLEHDDISKPDQIALIRYARDILGWDLRMVINTTGKSLHGLFDVSAIPPAQVSTDMDTLRDMGADGNVLRSSSTRAPGLIRQPDPMNPDKPHGFMQQILWINPR